jgi:hypothetical protein
MKILALASPFSGTRQFTNMLQAAGYTVGCETLDKDGMVRSMLIGDMVYMEGYDHIIHLVCNPLDTLYRLAAISKSRSKKLQWAMSMWVDTNSAIAYRATHRVRIEHALKDWPLQLYKPKSISRYRSYCKQVPIFRLDKLVIELAKEYGYGI